MVVEFVKINGKIISSVKDIMKYISVNDLRKINKELINPGCFRVEFDTNTLSLKPHVLQANNEFNSFQVISGSIPGFSPVETITYDELKSFLEVMGDTDDSEIQIHIIIVENMEVTISEAFTVDELLQTINDEDLSEYLFILE